MQSSQPTIARYDIEGRQFELALAGSPEFQVGDDECLSRKDTDPTFGQPWYETGFTTFEFLDAAGHRQLVQGIEASLVRILRDRGVTELEGFTLERYHHYVRSDQEHYAVVGITRDLFPEDFTFPLQELISKFEDFLGMPLTDVIPWTGERLHVIVRINRPGSSDFNPPHKDIYEDWDGAGVVPPFINFWVPVCGVTPESTLPMAAGTHLLPEAQILRTREGGVVDGKKYRVRTVLSWAGQTRLTRPTPQAGEVLVFSPHLVHGLAHNGLEDTTRVALEFRLFPRD